MRGLAAGITCLEPEETLHAAAGLGSLFCRLGPSRTQRAIDNIRASFPEKDEEECRSIAEQSMQHMFQLFLVDSLFMTRLVTPTTWPRYIQMGNVQSALDHLEPGRPALLFTGHHGNWELLGYTLAMMGLPITALARPLDNAKLNDWLVGIRESRGLRILTKWGATPEMHKTLERGDLVGFIADQNAGEGGLYVPFLGRLASSYKSIGLLALRYRTPIVAGTAIRRGTSLRYRFSSPDIIHPHEWDDQPDPLYYVTARVSRAMEAMVRETPEQYLWIHRRWKSRPRHERRGQPVPASLRRKIAALPWMTPDEVERVLEDSDRRAREVARASAGAVDGGKSDVTSAAPVGAADAPADPEAGTDAESEPKPSATPPEPAA